MSEKIFDAEEYKVHAQGVAERFEQRRATYMRRFKRRVFVAVLLLVSMPFWFSWVFAWNEADVNIIAGVTGTLVDALVALLLVLSLLIFALLPLFRYRRFTVQYGAKIPGMAGFAQQTVSLKSEIFNALMSFFGSFSLHNERKLSLKKFHAAPNMPDFDEFVSEDYIEGRMHDTHVEMTEAKLLIRTHNAYIDIFSGLMVIIETDDAISRHGRFGGKTVVIADRPADMDYVASKYGDYKRIKLSDSAFDSRFEVFSTLPQEAEKLISPDILRAILKLSDAVRHAKRQQASLDDRVAHSMGRLAGTLSDMLAFVGSRLAVWLQTGSFRVVSTRHALAQRGALAEDAKALNQCVHATFFDNRVIITIPHSHDLFEPDSLLRAPLHAEDIETVYQVMTSIGDVVDGSVRFMKGNGYS